MRRRLMLAMVGLVAVVLVIAGAGSLVLTRNAARNQAQQQLVSEANSLTSAGSGTRSLEVLRVVRATLKLENAEVIRIDRLGTIVTPLPDGLSAQDIDVAAVQSGQTTSGRTGNLVFAVAPVNLTQTERVRLRLGGTLAILLTRDVSGLGPSWGYFIVAGGAALLVAALVAWQMSRRMARPLVEAMQVTGRIASGELASRVPVRRGDYPEFASLAGSINDMAQSLEDSRARERHLLLAVSHDLRTPLTSIRGFAEAIQDGAIEDDAARGGRDHRRVPPAGAPGRRSARPHQARGAADVDLDAPDRCGRGGRDDGGGVPAGGGQVGAADRRRRPRVRHGTARRRHAGDARAPVAADPDRLAQLLANLLENAITFARTTVSVTLTHDAGSGACVITVDDDGPGIAQGDLERVFERFYRADRGPNRRMGSGLGLAIVAELAAAMGGSVRAESPTDGDGGSRFVVTLAPWRGAVPEVVRT